MFSSGYPVLKNILVLVVTSQHPGWRVGRSNWNSLKNPWVFGKFSLSGSGGLKEPVVGCALALAADSFYPLKKWVRLEGLGRFEMASFLLVTCVSFFFGCEWVRYVWQNGFCEEDSSDVFWHFWGVWWFGHFVCNSQHPSLHPGRKVQFNYRLIGGNLKGNPARIPPPVNKVLMSLILTLLGALGPHFKGDVVALAA